MLTDLTLEKDQILQIILLFFIAERVQDTVEVSHVVLAKMLAEKYS